jgi:hypothetical protein
MSFHTKFIVTGAVVAIGVASCQGKGRDVPRVSFRELISCNALLNERVVSVSGYLYPDEHVAIFERENAEVVHTDEFVRLSVDQEVDQRGHKIKLDDGGLCVCG